MQHHDRAKGIAAQHFADTHLSAADPRQRMAAPLSELATALPASDW